MKKFQWEYHFPQDSTARHQFALRSYREHRNYQAVSPPSLKFNWGLTLHQNTFQYSLILCTVSLLLEIIELVYILNNNNNNKVKNQKIESKTSICGQLINSLQHIKIFRKVHFYIYKERSQNYMNIMGEKIKIF